jgi:hypothetical protein
MAKLGGISVSAKIANSRTISAWWLRMKALSDMYSALCS